jgi:hypothetical protein
MVGAPKASGGPSITSLPRSTGTETTKAPTAPTTQAPETGGGKGAKQTGGGREAHNPVLQRLMADGFEGQGAQGKGLALGHHKEKKAGKKGGGEAGEAPAPTTGQPAGTPTGGTQQGGVEKLLADLTKLLGQFQAQYPQPEAAPTPGGNTGIVPPAPTSPAAPAPTPAVKLDGI